MILSRLCTLSYAMLVNGISRNKNIIRLSKFTTWLSVNRKDFIDEPEDIFVFVLVLFCFVLFFFLSLSFLTLA